MLQSVTNNHSSFPSKNENDILKENTLIQIKNLAINDSVDNRKKLKELLNNLSIFCKENNISLTDRETSLISKVNLLLNTPFSEFEKIKEIQDNIINI